MSIPEFRTKEQWIGTGLLTDYTFDFTIQDPTHLLLIVQDGTGAEVERIRGNDLVYLSGIVFDAKNGGGTVSLQAALPDTYVITALLAPDEPNQPSEYKGKFSFTLELFELALDRIVCQIQRLAYLAGRSLKLHDLDDITLFNMTMPKGAASNPGAALVINAAGNGIDYGATMGMIASAQGFATAASASKDAAAISAAAAAASAVLAAASAAAASVGMTMYGSYAAPLAITAAGGIASNIVGEQGSFIHGFPGAVTISANPQIAAGTVIGQKMTLIGCDDTNTVTLTNGNGLRLNGDMVLQDGDVISFIWIGANWQETYRSR